MRDALERLLQNIRQVFIGKDEAVRLAITTLLARGHLLIEDVPGLGKTLLARAIAQSLHAGFRRLQFTPDLLPSDVTGISVFHPADRTFEFVPGPVFSEVLLADEINRTSPRTQSSLLEAMEERQVTVEGQTRRLPDLFFVLATQNPVELAGTYPLPEAQIDRFLMRIELGYPNADDEVKILELNLRTEPIRDIGPVVELAELRRMQDAVLQVRVSPQIQRYVVAIAAATRDHDALTLGLSPRGSVALMRAAQAWSFLDGADFVGPDAVKAVARAVLGHRLVVEPQREHTGLTAAAVIDELLRTIPVPTLPEARTATPVSR